MGAGMAYGTTSESLKGTGEISPGMGRRYGGTMGMSDFEKWEYWQSVAELRKAEIERLQNTVNRLRNLQIQNQRLTNAIRLYVDADGSEPESVLTDALERN